MHLFWAPSNKFLLVLLAIAVAIVGVLATLVAHQQHTTAATAPAASVPAGADAMATPHAATHPNPATTPNPTAGRTGAPDHHATSAGAVAPNTPQTENSAPPASKSGSSTTPGSRGAPDNSGTTNQYPG